MYVCVCMYVCERRKEGATPKPSPPSMHETRGATPSDLQEVQVLLVINDTIGLSEMSKMVQLSGKEVVRQAGKKNESASRIRVVC